MKNATHDYYAGGDWKTGVTKQSIKINETASDVVDACLKVKTANSESSEEIYIYYSRETGAISLICNKAGWKNSSGGKIFYHSGAWDTTIK